MDMNKPNNDTTKAEAPVEKLRINITKSAEEVKANTKKAARRAKNTAKNITDAAKDAAKETVKAVEKKVAAKTIRENVYIQYAGKEITAESLADKAKKLSGAEIVKSVDVYVKPEENTAYYVVNGDISGQFEL